MEQSAREPAWLSHPSRPSRPVAATAGGRQLVLTVNGLDFRHVSLANWNGSPLATPLVNGNQLTAAVTAADITPPGAALVLVFNPPEGGTTFSGAIAVASTTAGSA